MTTTSGGGGGHMASQSGPTATTTTMTSGGGRMSPGLSGSTLSLCSGSVSSYAAYSSGNFSLAVLCVTWIIYGIYLGHLH